MHCISINSLSNNSSYIITFSYDYLNVAFLTFKSSRSCCACSRSCKHRSCCARKVPISFFSVSTVVFAASFNSLLAFFHVSNSDRNVPFVCFKESLSTWIALFSISNALIRRRDLVSQFIAEILDVSPFSHSNHPIFAVIVQDLVHIALSTLLFPHCNAE
jgi:hypothetical protein